MIRSPNSSSLISLICWRPCLSISSHDPTMTLRNKMGAPRNSLASSDGGASGSELVFSQECLLQCLLFNQLFKSLGKENALLSVTLRTSVGHINFSCSWMCWWVAITPQVNPTNAISTCNNMFQTLFVISVGKEHKTTWGTSNHHEDNKTDLEARNKHVHISSYGGFFSHGGTWNHPKSDHCSTGDPQSQELAILLGVWVWNQWVLQRKIYTNTRTHTYTPAHAARPAKEMAIHGSIGS